MKKYLTKLTVIMSVIIMTMISCQKENNNLKNMSERTEIVSEEISSKTLLKSFNLANVRFPIPEKKPYAEYGVFIKRDGVPVTQVAMTPSV